MGNAFTGHCNGVNPITAKKINTVIGSETNSGINKSSNAMSESFAEQENLSECQPYTPSNPTYQIPQLSDSTIAKFYYQNKFTVNNLVVNKSCNIIPRGLIIAWYGSGVPDGWALCDGTNCTPDLRGRAIFGYDSVNKRTKIGQTGGDETHLLTIGELPVHAHSYKINGGTQQFLTSASGSGKHFRQGKKVGATKNMYTYINDTKNLPHNNMPPFVVCSYIMKL